MDLGITLVVIIILCSAIFTLLLAGKSDEGYRNATKKNTTSLSLVYVVAIIFSLIALGVYIRWFA